MSVWSISVPQLNCRHYENAGSCQSHCAALHPRHCVPAERKVYFEPSEVDRLRLLPVFVRILSRILKSDITRLVQVAKNPSRPQFNHYLFESISCAIRNISLVWLPLPISIPVILLLLLIADFFASSLSLCLNFSPLCLMFLCMCMCMSVAHPQPPHPPPLD